MRMQGDPKTRRDVLGLDMLGVAEYVWESVHKHPTHRNPRSPWRKTVFSLNDEVQFRSGGTSYNDGFAQHSHVQCVQNVIID